MVLSARVFKNDKNPDFWRYALKEAGFLYKVTKSAHRPKNTGLRAGKRLQMQGGKGEQRQSEGDEIGAHGAEGGGQAGLDKGRALYASERMMPAHRHQADKAV